jgi:hypothetical protein
VRIGALALVALALITVGAILYGVADLRFGGYLAFGGMILALAAIALARRSSCH